PFIIAAPSLEGAELIPLASRQFRDLSLSFANQVALEADRYNIDMFALAAAVRQGDPQGTLQLPTPSLGGRAGRHFDSGPLLDTFLNQTNERVSAYPAQMVARFAQRRGV